MTDSDGLSDPIEELPLVGGYSLRMFNHAGPFYLFLDGDPVKSSADTNVAVVDSGNHEAVRNFALVIQELRSRIGGAIEAEREACAALTDAWPNAQKYTADRFTYGVQMATELADAIRARTDV